MQPTVPIPALRLRNTAVGKASSSLEMPLTVAGMVAHNRRLAHVWALGEPGGTAVPLTKLQVPKDSADVLHDVICRDWLDGELVIRHPVSGKVKAVLKGFSEYGSTRQSHDPRLQALHTIVLDGAAHFNIFRLGVPGFAPIESALLKHAEKWCALWPMLLPP
jgi:hypothetical protein